MNIDSPLITSINQCSLYSDDEKTEIIFNLLSEYYNLKNRNLYFDSNTMYLHLAFIWSTSKFGYDYWLKVSSYLSNSIIFHKELYPSKMNRDIDLVTNLVESILRCNNLPRSTKQIAIKAIQDMFDDPNHIEKYGFNEYAQSNISIFKWELAIQGDIFWKDLFININSYEKP